MSSAGFYACKSRPPSARTIADQALTAQIRAIHERSRATYGAPRVHAELRLDHGVHVGRKRVARLMRAAGLVGCHRRRRPTRGLVHHRDQAANPPSLAFGRRCREAGITSSMGSVGDAYDNAMAESFFATLECERLHRHRFTTRIQARVAVFDDLEGFSNPRRRHSALASAARPTTNGATSSTTLPLSPDLSTGPGQLQQRSMAAR